VTPDPAITTDVFEYLCGEGFVMVSETPTSPEVARRRSEALDEIGKLDGELLWGGIEGDVAELEALLK
jgi:hypothetical protein